MGVVIESEVWELQPWSYFFLFFSCSASIVLLPYFLNNSKKNLLDLGGSFSSVSAPFLRFQRGFLIVYSLASAMEGLQSVYGEFEYGYYGLAREQMLLVLISASLASLLIGTFIGMLSDFIGHRKACLVFCFLNLFVGILRSLAKYPSIWMSGICLAIASSIFSCSFETWVVAEHEKLGYQKDFLSDTFWLMTFSESASLIGSQMLANSLVSTSVEYGIVLPNAAAVFLAVICIVFICKGWKNESAESSSINSYKMAFSAQILSDKRVWCVAWAQNCLHFSVATFWLLWVPTVVADGREVHVEMIYPCLMGARMLGSTALPWLLSGALSVSTEDCSKVAFLVAGFALSVVAFDYQEIGVLVILFCLFNACVGLILPSLARLRSFYVPNELRAGMISLSLVPANATVLCVLIQVHDFITRKVLFQHELRAHIYIQASQALLWGRSSCARCRLLEMGLDGFVAQSNSSRVVYHTDCWIQDQLSLSIHMMSIENK